MLVCTRPGVASVAPLSWLVAVIPLSAPPVIGQAVLSPNCASQML
jgi:hypothetical protein